LRRRVSAAAAGAAETPRSRDSCTAATRARGPYEALDAAEEPPRLQRGPAARARGIVRREAEFRFGAWPAILRQLDREEVDLSAWRTRTSAPSITTSCRDLDAAASRVLPEDRLSPPHGLDQLGGEMIAVPARLYMHDFLAGLPEAQTPAAAPVAAPPNKWRFCAKREVTAVAGNELLLRQAAAQAGLYSLRELPVKALSYQLANCARAAARRSTGLPPALDRLRASG
jgi:hypothetical protein